MSSKFLNVNLFRISKHSWRMVDPLRTSELEKERSKKNWFVYAILCMKMWNFHFFQIEYIDFDLKRLNCLLWIGCRFAVLIGLDIFPLRNWLIIRQMDNLIYIYMIFWIHKVNIHIQFEIWTNQLTNFSKCDQYFRLEIQTFQKKLSKLINSN